MGVYEIGSAPSPDKLHEELTTRINDYLKGGGDPSAATTILAALHQGTLVHWVLAEVSNNIQEVVAEGKGDAE